MENLRIKATFVRGGTSKALCFHVDDLPADKSLWDDIFLHVMGSPDGYGRQLDGMGGGVSSLSKIIIVGRSSHPNADVDYTFVQVDVTGCVVDYGGMCGNMSSAVGPFAVDEGMVSVPDNGQVTVRIINTNTNKLFNATFAVRGGKTVEQGDFEISGVSQSGACIKLDYLSPAGAVTGQLLPTGNTRDVIEDRDFGVLEVSLVDASNPMVYLRASDVGCTGCERPADLDKNTQLMDGLERIRRQSAVLMGMAETPADAPMVVPKIAIIEGADDFTALDGKTYGGASYHIAVRVVSMEKIHNAVPLTSALCTAVTASITGTLVHDIVSSARVPSDGASSDGMLTIGNPSGTLPVQADVRQHHGNFDVISASAFRTQRRIMEGAVLCPAQLLCK